MTDYCLNWEYKSSFDVGISQAAQSLNKKLNDITSYLRENVSNEPYKNILEELKEIYSDCLEENWDGYRAKAISETTYTEARRFIELFPSISFHCPELSIDPDGDIVFEWNYNNKIFSISINSTGTLTYAGLYGFNKTHGVENFNNKIPQTIFDNIKRVFSI